MHTPRRLLSSRILLWFLTLFSPIFAISQNGPGWIEGTVLDTGGAVLQGAQVQLLPKGSALQRIGRGLAMMLQHTARILEGFTCLNPSR